MATRIAVIGLGSFGTSLALSLARLGSEVLVIDANRAKVENIQDKVAGGLILDATQERALRAQGLEQMDTVVVAIGGHFDAALLIVTLLQQFGVKHILARATEPIHRQILNKIGVTDVVSPAEDMGNRLAHRLTLVGSTEAFPIGPEHIAVKRNVPPDWVGQPLGAIKLRENYSLNLITILRQDQTQASREVYCIGIPVPATIFEKGDVLLLFGHEEDLANLPR
jgi:trk system potassium uptake protein TrkA